MAPTVERDRVRSTNEFNKVQTLIAAGMNDCAIARETGIPRPTVRDWRVRPPSQSRRPQASSHCGIDHDFGALPPRAYAYLLGLYLGDGCVSWYPRAWRLRVTLDSKYPGIIDSCRAAIDTLMPGQHASVGRQRLHAWWSRCTPNTGHACSPNTGLAVSTTDRFGSRAGSRILWTGPPRTSCAA